MSDLRARVPAMSDLQRVFPPEVHESLAELRRIAKAATTKDDPRLRRCTADELALATQLRKPWHCDGHNSRTGLPCRRAKLSGLNVCRRHGGAAKHARLAGQRRLAELIPGSIDNMAWLSQQLKDSPAVAQKANADILDRAGIGALVQAKVRASKKQDSAGPTVTVNIGFLG